MAISNSTDRFNGVVASLAIKVRCVGGIVTNVPALTGINNPYDGLFVVENDRLLLTAQNNPIENGIWVVNATGIWARAADWDGSRDVEKGSTVWAGRSGGQSDLLWQVTNPAGVIQPGTTAVTITELMDPDLVGQNNPIVLAELAFAGPDNLGFGQIWVRDDDPNVLMFTDDLGTDFVLSVPAATDLESVTTIGNTTTQGIDVTFGSQLRVFNIIQDANLTIDVTNVGGPVNMVANSALIMTAAGNMDLGFDVAGFLNFNPGGNNVMSLTNNICRVNTDSGGFFQIRDDIGSTLNCTMTTSGPNYIAAAIVGGDPDRYLFQPVSGGSGLVFQMAEAAGQAATISGYGQIWVSPGGGGDPFWSEVEILADMEGPDAATSYTEISQNTANMAFVGNAQLDTAQFNSGTSSLLLDGTGDWATFPDIAAYDIGTQSWTIEGFVRFNTLPPLQASTGPGFVLYDSRRAGAALIQYGIIQDAFGFRVRLVGQDWGAEVGTISGGISTGVWYHWAVTRDVGGDNNVRAYFNGLYEVADFGVSPADLGNPDAPIYIGSRTGVDAYHDGWIDDVRVTIGTARYAGTGAYSVPTTPYQMAPVANSLIYTDNLDVSTVLSGPSVFVPPIVLLDDQLIEFGSAAPDISLSWSSSLGVLLFQGASEMVRFPLGGGFQLQNVGTNVIEFVNEGVLGFGDLVMRVAAGGLTNVSMEIGPWDHNGNRLGQALLDDFSVQNATIVSVAGVLTLNHEFGTGADTFLTTLFENVTSVVLDNPSPSGQTCYYELEIIQDAGSLRTIVWPGTIEWDGGTLPDLTTLGAKFLVNLRTRDNGTGYLATWSGPYS